jgi:hypothetical protein
VEFSGNVLDPAFKDRSIVVEGGRPETIRIEGWR